MTERTPEQQFYDQYGYYARQDYNPKDNYTYVAWERDMDSGPRHCWIGRDGTRYLDNRAPEYDYDSVTNVCTVDHSAEPRVVGEVEWMRFIHAYLKLAGDGQRYFTTDGTIWINPAGLPMSNGRVMYAESYFNQRPCDEAQLAAFSFRLKFTLFLHSKIRFARIECYDPELYDLCQKAWMAVEASYEAVPA